MNKDFARLLDAIQGIFRDVRFELLRGFRVHVYELREVMFHQTFYVRAREIVRCCRGRGLVLRKSDDVCCCWHPGWCRRRRLRGFRGTHRVVHVFLFFESVRERAKVWNEFVISFERIKHGLKSNDAIHGRRRGHETRLDEHRFVQTVVRGCVFVVVLNNVIVINNVRGKEKVFRFCLPDTRDRPPRTPNEKRRFTRRIRRERRLDAETKKGVLEERRKKSNRTRTVKCTVRDAILPDDGDGGVHVVERDRVGRSHGGRFYVSPTDDNRLGERRIRREFVERVFKEQSRAEGWAADIFRTRFTVQERGDDEHARRFVHRGKD